MRDSQLLILLVDDDKDDCFLFNEALEEIPLSTHLTTLFNGEQLTKWLIEQTNILPDVLFLDLNMPGKNGFECLTEIKQHERLRSLPVVIISTSFDQEIANLLYKKGAHLYIRKPNDFKQLKNAIHKALTIIADRNAEQPARDKFVIKDIVQISNEL